LNGGLFDVTVNSKSSSPKTELRRALRLRLKSEPAKPTHHAALNQRLLALIRSSIADQSAKGVWAGFAATDFEPDILPTMRALENEVEWALPRVEEHHLAFYLVDDFSTLVRNRWGILEPRPERSRGPVAVAHFAGMIIPGVAFDHHGNRLGRGRGFYDRALAASTFDKKRTIKIGVGFERQISAEEIPTESFDRPMDWVVTEAHAYCCGSTHS